MVRPYEPSSSQSSSKSSVRRPKIMRKKQRAKAPTIENTSSDVTGQTGKIMRPKLKSTGGSSKKDRPLPSDKKPGLINTQSESGKNYPSIFVPKKHHSGMMGGAASRRYPKIDLKQIRDFYNFLPWANRPGLGTVIMIKSPVASLSGDNQQLGVLRCLAENENDFVDLIKNPPSWQRYCHPRDFYVCTSPFKGSFHDYFKSEKTRPHWVLDGKKQKKDFTSEHLHSHQMFCLDIDKLPLEEALQLFERVRAGLKLKRYLLVQSGNGMHVWVPMEAVEELPGKTRIKNYICDEILELAKNAKERKAIDEQPFARLAYLRIPGTWNTKAWTGESAAACRPVNISSDVPSPHKGPNNPRLVECLNSIMATTATENKHVGVTREEIDKKSISALDVEEAAARLKEHLERHIKKSDGKIHLICPSPGTGKSRMSLAAMETLAEHHGVRTLMLGPNHQLLAEQLDTLKDRAAKMPKLTRDNCCPERYKQAMKARDRGFLMDVCQSCPLYDRSNRMRCRYHQEYTEAKKADILFAPSDFIKVKSFWKEGGGGYGRKFVFIDESILDELQEQVDIPFKGMKALRSRLYRAMNAAKGELREAVKACWMLCSGILKMGNASREELGEFLPKGVTPPEWTSEFSCALTNLIDWGNATHRGLSRLRALCTAWHNSGGKALLFRIPKADEEDEESDCMGYRFFIPHDLPVGPTYFLLDATTDPVLLRAHFGSERIAPRLFPMRIALKGEVVQVMDRLWGKVKLLGAIANAEKNMEGDSSIRRRPAFLIAIDTITEKLHPDARKIAVISHKAEDKKKGRLVDRLVSLMKDKDRVVKYQDEFGQLPAHFGALRGTNLIEKLECDLLLIVGTYRLPQKIVEHRAAAFASRASEEERNKWIEGLNAMNEVHDHLHGWKWTVKDLPYVYSSNLQGAVFSSYVIAELTQAIGRTRPIRHSTPVYVITHEPLHLHGLKRCFSKELVAPVSQAERRQREKDLYYEKFRKVVEQMLGEGLPVYPTAIASYVKAHPEIGVKCDRETITQSEEGAKSHWERWLDDHKAQPGLAPYRQGKASGMIRKTSSA